MMLNIQVAKQGDTRVMSSVDLSKICVGESKDAHANFMKKAYKVLGEDIVKFYDISKDFYGRGRKILLLPQRESCLMAMSYSYELQAYVFDKWQELENQQAPQLPQSFAEALQLAADQAKQIEQQTQEIEHQQKHITGLENLFHSGGTIAQFVKQLNGVNSNLVNSWLYENTNWLYDSNAGKVYQSGRPKPHEWRCASYARDKYLTERTINIERQGMESITKYKVELLAEGKKWIYRKYIKGVLPMKAKFNGKYTHEKDLV